MYKVTVIKINNYTEYYVKNMSTDSIHSRWESLELALQCMRDLNATTKRQTMTFLRSVS